MSVSAVQQSESAMHILYPPVFGFPSHLGHNSAPSRVLCAVQWRLTVFFMHSGVYVSVPGFQSIALSLVSICLLSTSVFLFLLCTQDHLYHFSRFHIYALIYHICFSDLLPSVWQSLGPSMSLQMTQFCSFLWLSIIPLCICTTASSAILLLMDI